MRILPRFGAALLFLAMAATAHAVSFVTDVMPGPQPSDKVEVQGFTFEIKSSRPTPGEVAFHIVITEGTQKFRADNPSVSLSAKKVITDSNGNPTGMSITGVSGMPEVSAKHVGNTLTCDFTVPEKSLDDPGFDLEFENPVFVTLNDGTKMGMPSADIYLVNLKDFAASTTSAVTAGVQKSDYGKTADGTAVELYTLTNHKGAVAKIITYGATIVDLEMPDRDGKFANVVLATDTPANFLRFNSPASVMGRVANRIAGASFTLDGHDYPLFANDGPNTLHGGKIGFSKVVWKAEIPAASPGAAPAVKLTYLSKDGDEGFPGNLTASVTYTLTDQNVFRLEYSATTDKPTPVNLTNHAFFNLAGGKGDSNNYELMINADRYTVADAALIPTGEIAPVKDTAMDFTQPAALGARAAQLGANPHYDHSFVLNRDKDAGAALALAARVSEPASGRSMEVWTNQPGLQLYTSTLSANPAAARPGRGAPRAGFLVLETQHFPDAVHHANFPNTILHPGEIFTSETEYRFTAK